MKLHELLEVMKPGDFAKQLPSNHKVYMNEDYELLWEKTNGDYVSLHAGVTKTDWQLIQKPLPVGEWIDPVTADIMDRIPAGHRIWCELDSRYDWTGHSNWVPGRNDLLAGATRIFILPDQETDNG